jgi:hypothetical protein
MWVMVTKRKAGSTAPISRVRCFAVLVAGVLTVGMGGFLVFDNPNPPAIPLFYVWLAGLLLSQAGVAMCIGGVAWALFGGPAEEFRDVAAWAD